MQRKLTLNRARSRLRQRHCEERYSRPVDAATEVAPLPNGRVRPGKPYSSLSSGADCRSLLLSAWRDIPSISAAMD